MAAGLAKNHTLFGSGLLKVPLCHMLFGCHSKETRRKTANLLTHCGHDMWPMSFSSGLHKWPATRALWCRFHVNDIFETRFIQSLLGPAQETIGITDDYWSHGLSRRIKDLETGQCDHTVFELCLHDSTRVGSSTTAPWMFAFALSLALRTSLSLEETWQKYIRRCLRIVVGFILHNSSKFKSKSANKLQCSDAWTLC